MFPNADPHPANQHIENIRCTQPLPVLSHSPPFIFLSGVCAMCVYVGGAGGLGFPNERCDQPGVGLLGERRRCQAGLQLSVG